MKSRELKVCRFFLKVKSSIPTWEIEELRCHIFTQELFSLTHFSVSLYIFITCLFKCSYIKLFYRSFLYGYDTIYSMYLSIICIMYMLDAILRIAPYDHNIIAIWNFRRAADWYLRIDQTPKVPWITGKNIKKSTYLVLPTNLHISKYNLFFIVCHYYKYLHFINTCSNILTVPSTLTLFI